MELHGLPERQSGPTDLPTLTSRKAWSVLRTFGSLRTEEFLPDDAEEIQDILVEQKHGDVSIVERQADPDMYREPLEQDVMFYATRTFRYGNDNQYGFYFDQSTEVLSLDSLDPGHVVFHAQRFFSEDSVENTDQLAFRLETHRLGAAVLTRYGFKGPYNELTDEEELWGVYEGLQIIEQFMWASELADSDSDMRTTPRSDSDIILANMLLNENE